MDENHTKGRLQQPETHNKSRESKLFVTSSESPYQKHQENNKPDENIKEVILKSNIDLSTLLESLKCIQIDGIKVEEKITDSKIVDGINYKVKDHERLKDGSYDVIKYTEQSDGSMIEPKIRHKLMFKTPHNAEQYMKLEVMRTKLFSCVLPDERVLIDILKNNYSDNEIEFNALLKFTYENVRMVFRCNLIRNKYSDIRYDQLEPKQIKKMISVINDSIKVRSIFDRVTEFEFLRYINKDIIWSQPTFDSFNPIVFEILDYVQENIMDTKQIFVSPGINYAQMSEIKFSIMNDKTIDLQTYDCAVLLHSLLEFIKNTIKGLIPQFTFMEIVDAYHNIKMVRVFHIMNMLIPTMMPFRRILLAKLLEICKLIKENEEAVLCTFAESIHRLAGYVFSDNYHLDEDTHRIKVIILDALCEMNFYYLPEWISYFKI